MSFMNKVAAFVAVREKQFIGAWLDVFMNGSSLETVLVHGRTHYPTLLRNSYRDRTTPEPEVQEWWASVEARMLAQFPFADRIVLDLITRPAHFHSVMDAIDQSQSLHFPFFACYYAVEWWSLARCREEVQKQLPGVVRDAIRAEIKGGRHASSLHPFIGVGSNLPLLLADSFRDAQDEFLPIAMPLLALIPATDHAHGSVCRNVVSEFAPAVWARGRLTPERRRALVRIDSTLLQLPEKLAQSKRSPQPSDQRIKKIRAETLAIAREMADEALASPAFDPKSWWLQRFDGFTGVEDLARVLRRFEQCRTAKDASWAYIMLSRIGPPSDDDQRRASDLAQFSPDLLVAAACLRCAWADVISAALPAPFSEALPDLATWFDSIRKRSWWERKPGDEASTPTPADIRIARDALVRAAHVLSTEELKRVFADKFIRHEGLNAVYLAEAVLGWNAVETEARFVKRDKVAVAALGLLPLEDDAVDRYHALLRFRDESKQFGSQRRASEATAVELGLHCLAVTAGYDDFADLEIAMERASAGGGDPFAQAWTIGPYEVRITSTPGFPFAITRDGKLLRGTPSALKQDAEYLDLKVVRERLVAQRERIVGRLENLLSTGSAVNGDRFREFATLPASADALAGLLFRVKFDNGEPETVLWWEELAPRLDDVVVAALVHPLQAEDEGFLADRQRDLIATGRAPALDQLFRARYRFHPDVNVVQMENRFKGAVVILGSLRTALTRDGWAADHDYGIYRQVGGGRYSLVLEDNTAVGPATETVTVGSIYPMLMPRAAEPSVDWPTVESEILRSVDRAITVAVVDKAVGHRSPELLRMREEIVRAYLPDAVVVDGCATVNEFRVDLQSGVATSPVGAPVTFPDARLPDTFPVPNPDARTAKIIAGVLSLSSSPTRQPQLVSQA